MAVSLGKFAPQHCLNQQAGYFYFGAVYLLKWGTTSLEYLKEVMPVQASLRLYFLGLTYSSTQCAAVMTQFLFNNVPPQPWE